LEAWWVYEFHEGSNDLDEPSNDLEEAGFIRCAVETYTDQEERRSRFAARFLEGWAVFWKVGRPVWKLGGAKLPKILRG